MKAFHKEPPVSTRSLEFFDTNNAFDTKKARDVLGFAATHSLEDGLEDCKDWIQRHL
jgi:nucleoside-diphosphate-sugar epimerase